jgi:uncharacterized protein
MINKTNELEELTTFSMPFGKYQGVPLIDLPENYVLWLHGSGLPTGKLGQLVGLLYEIKLNGLEHLVHSLRVR